MDELIVPRDPNINVGQVFEWQVNEKIRPIIDDWNSQNPTRQLTAEKARLQGVDGTPWEIDCAISNSKGYIALISMKSCKPSSTPASHKQAGDRAFVDFCAIKLKHQKDIKDTNSKSAKYTKYYLLTKGVRLDAIHNYERLFKSIGVTVYNDTEWDKFEKDLKDHIEIFLKTQAT